MFKKKINFLILLMSLSITLLVVLQGLWLRAEYKAATDSFRRETNLLFRTTAHQLADSIFFSQLKLLPGYDSINGGQFPMLRLPGMQGDSARQARSLSIRSIDLQAGKADTLFSQVTVITGDKNDSTSMARFSGNETGPRNFRYMLSMFTENFSPDSLKAQYQKALPDHFQSLGMTIVEKEVDWFQHGWGRAPQERNDSLPFLTGYVPMGLNRVYAANFSGVRKFLFIQILPQIGFSVFITGLILLSFIAVSRNLRAQQRLIEQKNDFIGNMTHELKTPVATVGVALEAMKNFDVLKDPKKASEYIEMAQHELDRLVMMTDKILKTSIFDYETEIRNNKVVVDLAEIIKKVNGSFQLLAEKKKINLSFIQSGQGSLLGNEEHLTQMVYNLLDNAFKYADNGPQIKVALSEHPDYLLLVVEDEGPGIAEEHHTKIFEKFYRVPSGNVHTVKGYGLGLNYVAGVVKSHGGKINLESKPGNGATFEIKFPKKTSQPL